MVTAAGAQSWRQMLAEEGWSRHLTTLEGWREFTTAQTIPPELLTGPQRAAMPQTGQLLYDEFRLDYHTRLAAVATSALRQVVSTGRRLTLLNRHAISARRGLILSGAAGTGETTAITQFGKTRRAEGWRDLRRLPELLLQPLALDPFGGPEKPVWHCSVRAAPGDRVLSDAEWGRVAASVVERTGFAPEGDDRAVRWVAGRRAAEQRSIA